MNVLSLFDGMSCGQIALAKAGIKVNKYYAAEVDKYAIQVTQNNYPGTIQLGDVTKWREWDLDWPGINLLIGGSPCQGFSFAGQQLAFDDPRSALFFVYVDILNHIKSVNPGVIFMLENVKMKQCFMDVISSQLGVSPVFINSDLVSAQSRRRMYWASWEFSAPSDLGISLNNILQDGFESNRLKSYCIDANYSKGANFKRYFFRASRQIVFKGGLIDKSDMTEQTANQYMRDCGIEWRILTPGECEALQTVPHGYTKALPDRERYRVLGNGWTVDVIVHIFKSLPGAALLRKAA